jgi:hypothetical protein
MPFCIYISENFQVAIEYHQTATYIPFYCLHGSHFAAACSLLLRSVLPDEAACNSAWTGEQCLNLTCS